MNCMNCGKETSNPKYCGRSCAAVVSNKMAPRRKARPNFCKECSESIRPTRTYCKECYANRAKDMPLKDAVYDTYGKPSAYALVRARARASLKGTDMCCAACGYAKHVEVCHIRPICDFPKDALVSEVNALDNLILLCPNCHWEFDSGLLSIALSN